MHDGMTALITASFAAQRKIRAGDTMHPPPRKQLISYHDLLEQTVGMSARVDVRACSSPAWGIREPDALCCRTACTRHPRRTRRFDSTGRRARGGRTLCTQSKLRTRSCLAWTCPGSRGRRGPAQPTGSRPNPSEPIRSRQNPSEPVRNRHNPWEPNCMLRTVAPGARCGPQ